MRTSHWTWWKMSIVGVLVAAAWVGLMLTLPTTRATETTADADRRYAQMMGDEPCTVETLSEMARPAAEALCHGGAFTRVRISTNVSTVMGTLQFSAKGVVGWNENRAAVERSLRRLTNQLVDITDLDVALVLHDTTGRQVGRCARAHRSNDATCN